MVLKTYFKALDISIEILTNELTVFYNEYDTIQHVVQGLIKEGCLGQRYKSYSGTILTDKTYELTVKMNNGYVIYEYRKTFSGFSPADASGGGTIAGIPRMHITPTNYVTDNCPTKWDDSAAILSAKQVAKAWLIGGGTKDTCPAALIIAAGEGAPAGEGSANFYSAKASNSGVAGPWQVDSGTGTSKCTITNPCCNANAAAWKLNPPDKYMQTCDGSLSPIIIPASTDKFHDNNDDVGYAGQGLGGDQSNFIGPFCHAGKNTSGFWGVIYGGGGKWKDCKKGMYCKKNSLAILPVSDDSAYPFPWYYYDKYNTQMQLENPTCAGITPATKLTATQINCLNKLANIAIDSATKICKQAINYKPT